MELLLAQPLSRARLVLAHFCTDLVVIPVLCLSLWGGTLLGARLVGPFEVSPADLEPFKNLPFPIKLDPELLAIDPWALRWGLWNVGALIFAVSGVTMVLSAAGRFRNRVIGVAVVLMLVQFAVNVVGQLWDAVAWLRPFTVFYYFQPQQVVLARRWTVDPCALWGGSHCAVNVLAVLFAVGAAGYALALLVFTRRDLPAPL